MTWNRFHFLSGSGYAWCVVRDARTNRLHLCHIMEFLQNLPVRICPFGDQVFAHGMGRQIFGRLRPQKRSEQGTKATREKVRYVFLLQHFEKLKFTPEQIHIMKILHESMSFAALWLLVKVINHAFSSATRTFVYYVHTHNLSLTPSWRFFCLRRCTQPRWWL
jgi:hypothetical protein